MSCVVRISELYVMRHNEYMKDNSIFQTVVFVIFTMILSGCQYFSTDSQINYGMNHYKMGLYDRAIPYLLSAVKELENKEPTDPRLPQILIALGNMAISTKEENRVEDFFQRALKAAEKLTPTDTVQIRNALVHLGLYYHAHDREQEAVPLLKRASLISEDSANQVLYAIDLDNLGQAIDKLGRHEEANQLSLKALNVLDSLTQGEEEVKARGVILYNLAWSYMTQQKFSDAEQLYKQALNLLEDKASAQVESWRIKTVLKGYAKLLRQTNRIEEAKTLESRADQIQ